MSNPRVTITTDPPRPKDKKMRLKESGGVASWLMLSPSLIFLDPGIPWITWSLMEMHTLAG